MDEQDIANSYGCPVYGPMTRKCQILAPPDKECEDCWLEFEGFVPWLDQEEQDGLAKNQS